MKKIYKKLLAAGLGAALALSVAACGTNKETAKTRTLKKFSRLRQMQPMCLLNLKIKARVATKAIIKAWKSI